MKHTRLLEIIREEIAGALSEETNVTVTNSKVIMMFSHLILLRIN